MATEAPSDEVRVLRSRRRQQQRSRTRCLPRPAWSPMSLSRRSRPEQRRQRSLCSRSPRPRQLRRRRTEPVELAPENLSPQNLRPRRSRCRRRAWPKQPRRRPRLARAAGVVVAAGPSSAAHHWRRGRVSGSRAVGGGRNRETNGGADAATESQRRVVVVAADGEEAAPAPDDPTDTLVRVREPRRQDVNDEVTGIDGSTRMEAKRQRRREGREAGRRRAPAERGEFLARRESVTRKMIIRQRDDLAQIAVLEDDILVEHYVDRDSHGSLIGNVYLGRVQNVLPSMEAAFVDIGRGRNGVIYAERSTGTTSAPKARIARSKRCSPGQTILVQVSKDPIGAKGARLTNHVSIPGRYIVYAPGGHLSGISRKLPEIERRRLKEILSDLVGESASVIVRTAAEGASEEELVRDVNRLKAQWEDIERKVATGNAPQQLYAEPDLTVRIVRDLSPKTSELIISGNGRMTDAYDAHRGIRLTRRTAPQGSDASGSDHDLLLSTDWTSRLRKAWSARYSCLRVGR